MSGEGGSREGRLRLLYAALNAVALGADAQVEYLKTRGPWSVDDLALDHSHAAQAALRQGLLTNDQAAAVKALDQFLAGISGKQNRQLWTEGALRKAPEWTKARELAAEALRRLSPDPAANQHE